jgi:polyferredoxin
VYLDGEDRERGKKMIINRTFIETNITTLRRISQVSTLIALVSLPLAGVLAIDIDSQSLIVAGARVWPHEGHLIASGFLMFLMLLGGFSLALGRFFCGWMCPQTLLCEMTSAVQGLLRRRGEGDQMRHYATALAIASAALVLSGFIAFALVSFFVSPQAFSDLLSGKINTSLLKAIVMAGFLLVVFVVFFRHTFCEWMCLFGWWQRIFHGDKSLRVAFDVRRGKDCTRCDGCKNSCFMHIDPRKRTLPPTCVNCAKCVAACHKEMSAVGKSSLIWYHFGQEPSRASASDASPSDAGKIRVLGFATVFVIAAGFFAWGVASRPAIEIKIRLAEARAVTIIDGQARGAFFIDIYSNGSQPVSLILEQSGLPSNAFTIEPERLVAEPFSKISARLSFATDPESLHAGRNELLVMAMPESNRNAVYAGHLVFGLPFIRGNDRDSSS